MSDEDQGRCFWYKSFNVSKSNCEKFECFNVKWKTRVDTKESSSLAADSHQSRSAWDLKNIFCRLKQSILSFSWFSGISTLRRPPCQSWHIKAFFSSNGSASTAMSKRWKNIPFIWTVRILWNYCKILKNCHN